MRSQPVWDPLHVKAYSREKYIWINSSEVDNMLIGMDRPYRDDTLALLVNLTRCGSAHFVFPPFRPQRAVIPVVTMEMVQIPSPAWPGTLPAHLLASGGTHGGTHGGTCTGLSLSPHTHASRPSVCDLGRLALEWLVSRLDGKHVDEDDLFPVQLLISTGAPPCR